MSVLLVGVTLGCADFKGSVCLEDDGTEEPRSPHRVGATAGLRDLAQAVTDLEWDIHRYGSITVKQPDVWGDANLMSYIQEYEQVMINRLGDLQPTIQGYVARSDQAQLQSITSLGVALSPTGAKGTGGGAAAGQSSSQTTVTVPTPFQGAATLPAAVKPLDLNTTANPAVFDVLNAALTPVTAAGKLPPFGIEPTESLRQNSTYVRVNQGLRRINSGDDNAQGAGYGLYLLRVPVSILPGRKTYQGFAGVANFRAQVVVDPNHLPVTIPKLAVADLADTVQPLLEADWALDDAAFLAALGVPGGTAPSPKSGQAHPSRHAMRSGASILTQSNPLTAQDAVDLYGAQEIGYLHMIARAALKDKFGNDPPPHDELRQFLFSYLTNSYLALRDGGFLGAEFVLPQLPAIGTAYVRGDATCLCQYRQTWETNIAKVQAGSQCGVPSMSQLQGHQFIGWMVAAQLAVLDRQLKDALRDVLRAGHLPCSGGDAAIEQAQFANPNPLPETLELWSAFIHAQYPLHVFTLDPKGEEQNIFDAFSRRRELQLAIAFSLANGNINVDQAIKFSRQLALDVATIDLNRTQVGFAHGDDTFGWYFYPRVQTPPEEANNLAALFRLIWSTGPTRRYDVRHRRLEPGIRECEVLLVMPNFVPELKLDVTTNWERLYKPGREKLDYEAMIDLGAEVEKVRAVAAKVSDPGCYRPGDYERLVSRIEQLEKMLPLQTFAVNVPYQYDLPGGQLFDKGAAFLRPDITGYYGLRFLTRDSSLQQPAQAQGQTFVGAQFFLTGRHFHPTHTHVIVGGMEAHSIPATVNIVTGSDASGLAKTLYQTDVEVISRELLKVTVKGFISSEWSSGTIPVRVATPAGLSNELQINPRPNPVAKSAPFAVNAATQVVTADYSWTDNAPLQFQNGKPASVLIDWQDVAGSAPQEIEVDFSFSTEKGNISFPLPATMAQPLDRKVSSYLIKTQDVLDQLQKGLGKTPYTPKDQLPDTLAAALTITVTKSEPGKRNEVILPKGSVQLTGQLQIKLQRVLQ